MSDFLRPVLEISVITPGVLLAYLPAISHLRHPLKRALLWLLPLLVLLPLVGGMVCYYFRIPSEPVLLALSILAMCVYCASLRMNCLESVSVALAIAALISCMRSIARSVNVLLIEGQNTPENALWLSLEAALVLNLMCWAFVALAWYPMRRCVKILLEDKNFAETWYIFWMFPTIFIALNLYMLPQSPESLYTGRIVSGYIGLSIIHITVLCVFYLLFVMLSNSINRNVQLLRENEFLALQRERYEGLRLSIEEARQARHDLRHHFSRLSHMAQCNDMEAIQNYLDEVTRRIPNLAMRFSENCALDSVIGHYWALARQDNIPFEAKVDLPAQLPMDEIDVALVLSNLLENAIDASLKLSPEKRHISLEAYIHSGHLGLIRVENNYAGTINEKNGTFFSSKRRGKGVGINSIRRIAEKFGGDSSFRYADGVFVAKVMLRGESSEV